MKYIKLFEFIVPPNKDKDEVESYLIDLRDEIDGARSMFDNNSKIEIVEYYNGSIEVAYPRHNGRDGGFAVVRKDPFELVKILEEFKNRVEELGYKSHVDVKFGAMGAASKYPDDISFLFKIRFDRV